jgi:protein-tyrosine phosphatase
MIYGFAFLLFAAALAFQALRLGGWWLLLLWPAASFVLVGVAYVSARPALLGKRPDGRLSPHVIPVLAPFLAFAWSTWQAQRLLKRGSEASEVAPGVWVGRRAGVRELPPNVGTVIDLTAEFWEPAGVCAGRRYVCVPTLDATASDEAAFREALDCVAAAQGPVYIHCAQGFGRSAALAAAVLIRRGLARDVGEAEAMLAKTRPGVRLYPRQRDLVRRVTDTDRTGSVTTSQ